MYVMGKRSWTSIYLLHSHGFCETAVTHIDIGNWSSINRRHDPFCRSYSNTHSTYSDRLRLIFAHLIKINFLSLGYSPFTSGLKPGNFLIANTYAYFNRNNAFIALRFKIFYIVLVAYSYHTYLFYYKRYLVLNDVI